MANDTVLLIDASRLFREGLRRIFADTSFVVVHESCSIDEALPFIESLQPSLVLADLAEGNEAVSEHIGRIRAAASPARIVVLTETIRIDRLADALAVGVDGYLLKNMSAAALQQSLALVLMGEKVFPSDLAHLLVDGRADARGESAQTGHLNGLSDREMQILGYLLDGASNKQIANALNISGGTVKVHLKAILKKIHAQNRTQAAIWALDHGIGRDMSGEAPRKPAPDETPDD
jgi:two-component system nitrate/nitrite response regulator NarL